QSSNEFCQHRGRPGQGQARVVQRRPATAGGRTTAPSPPACSWQASWNARGGRRHGSSGASGCRECWASAFILPAADEPDKGAARPASFPPPARPASQAQIAAASLLLADVLSENSAETSSSLYFLRPESG